MVSIFHGYRLSVETVPAGKLLNPFSIVVSHEEVAAQGAGYFKQEFVVKLIMRVKPPSAFFPAAV